MAERSVLVRLQANIADFKAQMAAAERAVDGVGKKSDEAARQATTSLGRLAQSAQQNRDAWNDAGTAMAAVGAVGVAALGATVKAAIDWESAWAGVTKTVDGTPEQLQAVEDGLRGLARTLPATHGEIAAVAEAAGQLGVQTGSIVAFTRTMVDLGETTNLTADQAATSLAQLMNVMQTAPQDVSRLGAALVALGNDGASTEADIVNMASYITGSARLIGASESDVLALANAMTSMGINAERGGGVMTRVMQDVYAAVQTGGEQLDTFADVAGMSSADFARAFRDDPIRAIDSFIQGLNRIESQGGNVVATLGELGYKGTQDTAVLLQLKGAGDLLTDSLDLGNQAWAENTALLDEAAKRYDTTASKLAIARNNIADAAIEIGDTFLPVLAELAGSLASVAGWFADLPDPIQGVIGGVAGVTAVAALAGGAFLLLFPRVMDTVSAFRQLRADSPAVASGLGKVGRAAGIAGVILGVAAAVRGLEQALGPAPASMERTTGALIAMREGLDDVDQLFRDQSTWDYGIDGLADAMDRLINPGVSARFNDFLGTLMGNSNGSDGRERVVAQFNAIGESLALMVQSGNAPMAAQQFGELADQWTSAGGDLQDLRDLLPGYVDALQDVENQQALTGSSGFDMMGAFDAVVSRFSTGYESFNAYAEALGLSEDATEDLRKRLDELGSTMADFIDPLGAYTSLLADKRAAEEESARATAEATTGSSESWEDFVTNAGVSADEYLQMLRDQVTAQNEWQTNMLILAGRVSQGTLDELARMGPEGAPLVADLVNQSDAYLAELDDVFARRAQDAVSAWGLTLEQAGPVLAEVARVAGYDTMNALAGQLAAGTTTVAAIAAQYGISLANGINPVLTSLGKDAIIPAAPRQVPGQYTPYANGGIEDHHAQISGTRGGHARVWAEPETGGEGYVPLSPAKRHGSLPIWREIGRRLNAPEMQQPLSLYADGGFWDPSDVPAVPSVAPYREMIGDTATASMGAGRDSVAAYLQQMANALAGGAFRPGGGRTPDGRGGLGPAAAAARQFVMGKWGLSNIGGYSNRNIAGTGVKSDHATGHAIDVMIPNYKSAAGIALGNEIANWFVTHSDQFGTKYVIWRDRINSGKGWAPYRHPGGGTSDTLQHRDHDHVSFFAKGGVLNPHVRDRGGPLLPGYTFNGTGTSEVVVDPRHYVDAARLARGTAVAAPAADRPVIQVGSFTAPDRETGYELLEELAHRWTVADRGGRYAEVAS